MAASSSCFSSAAKEYDVFISFRGEDTRDNFVSHLYSALSRSSIRAYIDYELRKGDEISPALIKAIQDSYGSLVVFSENYASSKWCLNELLKILGQRNQGHFVVPVFYKVDPSHVRKQTGSYGEAFAKREQDSRNDKNMLQKWKAALTEAASIAGFDSRSRTTWDESELIQNIVQDVLQKLDDLLKLDYIYQPGQLGLVGIDEYCGDIESLLQRFPVVGIWGMGGVGKTTIAKAVFDKLSSQYDGCCFFENIREELERNGPNYLRNYLLSELLNESFPVGIHKAVGLKSAMRRLNNKKVFIVLDDVCSSKQLEDLRQEFNCLRLDSKIIITTRDRHLLHGVRVEHKIYEVKGLSYQNSLKLFKLNAFNENHPEAKGYEELSKNFVDYADGSPLALKVLGSFLVSKSRKEWESAWMKLREIPNEGIQKVLKLSFDGLDYEEQQLFLDIACFFKGESKKRIIKLVDSFGFFGKIGIRILQDKALITISNRGSNRALVQMHDLIQEMGREIVRKESIEEPGRRSRLWHPKDVYNVLKYNTGTDAIQGIILNMSRIRYLSFNLNTFEKMNKLRFLKIYSSNNVESCEVYLSENIKAFSYKLRYLHWDGYPLQSLPSSFCVENLVELHMPHSHMKRLWDGVQDLINLKSIDLSASNQLIELPDFSKASNLESVNLSSCTSLRHIHSSILCLHTLETLELIGCWELENLRSEVHLKSLENLDISGCRSLKEFSLTSEKIRDLNIQGTAVRKLHSSVGRCNNLEYLRLWDSLNNLPSDLSELKSLRVLHVIRCRELDTLNLHIGFEGLQCLDELYLEDCCKLSQLTGDIKNLSCLRVLTIWNCERILYIPELPPSIEILRVINCTSLETMITSTPLECRISRYFLINCVKLDENSLAAITECAHFRIKQAARCKVGLDHDSSYAHDILLPGNKIPRWFRYQTTQRRITIEFPPHFHLVGFAFYCILSPEFLSNQGNYFSRCGCDCYLEDCLIKRFVSTSFSDELHLGLISDHVYIWYDQFDCLTVFNAMEYTRAKGQHTKKLFFEFYAFVGGVNTIRKDNVIKECGLWPIYASDYDNSINDIGLSEGLKLGYRTNDIEKEEQFLDPTNMELECDESGPRLIGTGVASSVFDDQDLGEPEPLVQTKESEEYILKPLPTDISTQNAWQDSPEINSLCPLNCELDERFEDGGEFPEDASEYHSFTSQMESDLELSDDFKADEQQPLTKKFKDLLSNLFHWDWS